MNQARSSYLADEGRYTDSPDWAQQMAALGEAVKRWQSNNPKVDPEQTEGGIAALRAEIWGQILDELYPPGGMEHEADYRRLVHEDLAQMSSAAMADERARLRMRLMLDPDPAPWFRERLTAVEGVRHAAR